MIRKSEGDSPLAALYKTPSFLVQWDNDLPYHLAQNLIRLRRLREISQAELAARMGTSQAKIARIEGGEENVTLRTIKKIADALKGRLALTLQPSEMQLPMLPNWWEYPSGATTAWGNQTPLFKGMLTIQQETETGTKTGTTIGARWETTEPAPLGAGDAALLSAAAAGETISITYKVNAVAEPVTVTAGIHAANDDMSKAS